MASPLDACAFEKFVAYLKIKTVQPNPDYEAASEFLLKYAEELGLPANVVEVHPGKPVVVMSWLGSKHGQSGCILLTSHIDVVPVDEEKWSTPPFEAKRIDGKIYARGSQDMKVVGVQYLEAIRRLKTTGFIPERTIHLTFVPDEEIGGDLGMKLFVRRKEFADLNIVFALDEGCPSLTNEVPVFHGQRSAWWIQVTCKGTPGHASMLKADTAGEKLWRVMDKLMRFREGQLLKYGWTYENQQQMGEMFSVNLTMVEGGKQPNVIPSELKAVFDIRIPPTVDAVEFEKQLHRWCYEVAVASGGAPDLVSISYIYKENPVPLSDVTSPEIAPFWSAIRGAIQRCSLQPRLSIFPASTDSHFIREMGVPAFGFSPLPRTPFLLHEHDEYVAEDVFLEGIHVYEEIIRSISAV